MTQVIKTNITVQVSNLDQACNFYSETLGLTLTNRAGDHYAELESPGVKIGLHPASAEVKYGDNISIGLGTLDFDGAVSDLEQAGLEVQVTQDGPLRLAHFADPDGNPLYLAEIQESAS